MQETLFTTEDTESTEKTPSEFTACKLSRSGQVEDEFATKSGTAQILCSNFFSVLSVSSVVKIFGTYTSSEKFSRLVSIGMPAACSFSENLGTMPVA